MPMIASTFALGGWARSEISAPTYGMKIGVLAGNPYIQHAMLCPSSCTRMHNTDPAANTHPRSPAYTAVLTAALTSVIRIACGRGVDRGPDRDVDCGPHCAPRGTGCCCGAGRIPGDDVIGACEKGDDGADVGDEDCEGSIGAAIDPSTIG